MKVLSSISSEFKKSNQASWLGTSCVQLIPQVSHELTCLQLLVGDLYIQYAFYIYYTSAMAHFLDKLLCMDAFAMCWDVEVRIK